MNFKFKHGQDLDDDGLTEQCLKEIKVSMQEVIELSQKSTNIAR